MRTNVIIVNKVSIDDHLSDAIPKGLDASGNQNYFEGVGNEIRTNRQRLDPTLDIKAEGVKSSGTWMGDKRILAAADGWR